MLKISTTEEASDSTASTPSTSKRNDVLRIKLARIAKGMPLFWLQKVQPESKPKAKQINYFLEAYWIAFVQFLNVWSPEYRFNVIRKIEFYGERINLPNNEDEKR